MHRLLRQLNWTIRNRSTGSGLRTSTCYLGSGHATLVFKLCGALGGHIPGLGHCAGTSGRWSNVSADGELRSS